MEQGRPFTLEDLEPANSDGLGRLLRHLDAQEKNWAALRPPGRASSTSATREAWANRATGEDLAAQIDPDFVFGPHTSVALALDGALATPDLVSE